MIAVCCFLPAQSVPSYGQSLFDFIFGGGAKPVPRAPATIAPPRPLEPARAEPTPRDALVLDDGDSGDQQSGKRDAPKAGRQTMCVRTCDGYYWPIRYPSNRKDADSDEALCKASCGTEVKLYSRPGPGTPAEEMKDEAGRAYADTPTAFLYRKRLVDGCACKPMPWSASERARHERYALVEEEKRIRLAEADRAAREAEEAARIAAAMTPQQRAVEAERVAALDAAVAKANADAGIGPGGVPLADAQVAAKPAAQTKVVANDAAERPRQKQRSREAKPLEAKAPPPKSWPTQVAAAKTAPPRQQGVQPGISLLGGPAKYRYPGD